MCSLVFLVVVVVVVVLKSFLKHVPCCNPSGSSVHLYPGSRVLYPGSRVVCWLLGLISRTKNSQPHLGPLLTNFSVGPKKLKFVTLLSIFLGVPTGSYLPGWGHACQHV